MDEWLTMQEAAPMLGGLELARITGHKDPRKLKIYYRKSAAELAKKLADER